MNGKLLILLGVTCSLWGGSFYSPVHAANTINQLTASVSSAAGPAAMAKFQDGGKWGLIDENGSVIMPPTYQYLESLDKDHTIFMVSNNVGELGKYKYINALHQEVDNERRGDIFSGLIEKRLDYVNDGDTYPSDSYVPMNENPGKGGLYGFLGEGEGFIISPQYKSVVTRFSQNIAFVEKTNGDVVAIDGEGKELFVSPYKQVYPYMAGAAEFRLGKVKLAVVDDVPGFKTKMNNFNSDPYTYDLIGYFNYRYDGVKRGYMDKTGQEIISINHEKVWPMTKLGTFIEDAGHITFVTPTGKTIFEGDGLEPVFLSNYNQIFAMKDKKSKLVGLYDANTGQPIAPLEFTNLSMVGKNRVLAEQNGTYQLMSVSPFTVLQTFEKGFKPYNYSSSEYTWLVNEKTKTYKAIDNNGQTTFNDDAHALQQVSSFVGDYAPVKSNGKWGILKYDGTWFVPARFSELKMFNSIVSDTNELKSDF